MFLNNLLIDCVLSQKCHVHQFVPLTLPYPPHTVCSLVVCVSLSLVHYSGCIIQWCFLILCNVEFNPAWPILRHETNISSLGPLPFLVLMATCFCILYEWRHVSAISQYSCHILRECSFMMGLTSDLLSGICIIYYFMLYRVFSRISTISFPSTPTWEPTAIPRLWSVRSRWNIW